MPIGEIFLYVIWGLMAVGALIVSAIIFREH